MRRMDRNEGEEARREVVRRIERKGERASEEKDGGEREVVRRRMGRKEGER